MCVCLLCGSRSLYVCFPLTRNKLYLRKFIRKWILKSERIAWFCRLKNCPLEDHLAQCIELILYVVPLFKNIHFSSFLNFQFKRGLYHVFNFLHQQQSSSNETIAKWAQPFQRANPNIIRNTSFLSFKQRDKLQSFEFVI